MKFLLVLLLQFSFSAMAVSFECILNARNNLMEKFETITRNFDTEKLGMDLQSKGFTLKVRSTLFGGKDHLALVLKKAGISTSTMGPEEQTSFYINLYVDPAFAVGNCKRKE